MGKRLHRLLKKPLKLAKSLSSACMPHTQEHSSYR